MNTSTLRGHQLPLTQVIDIAAEAGYAGVEIRLDELDRHLAGGGHLAELRRRLDEQGLRLTGAIAFHEWMVDDDARRRAALDDARRRLEQLAALGATHMAAPPAGDVERVDLLAAAERYRALLELADPIGVVPAVELWGFAKNLYRLGQCIQVAVEAEHPKACILPDVYHLYKGGSGLAGLRFVHPRLLAGFHFNDLPAGLDRADAADRDRVYPGDGSLPIVEVVRDLAGIGYAGPISVELFNPDYYRQDPAEVARTALAKTRAVLRAGGVAATRPA